MPHIFVEEQSWDHFPADGQLQKRKKDSKMGVGGMLYDRFCSKICQFFPFEIKSPPSAVFALVLYISTLYHLILRNTWDTFSFNHIKAFLMQDTSFAEFLPQHNACRTPHEGLLRRTTKHSVIVAYLWHLGCQKGKGPVKSSDVMITLRSSCRNETSVDDVLSIYCSIWTCHH